MEIPSGLYQLQYLIYTPYTSSTKTPSVPNLHHSLMQEVNTYTYSTIMIKLVKWTR